MIIVGKATPIEEQLEAIKRTGVKHIEIQLVRNAIPTDLNRIKNVSDIDVVSVHTPIQQTVSGHKNDDVTVEYLGDPEQNEAMRSTCEFAQGLAEYFKHDINVVIHNGLSVEQWRFMPALLNNIIEIFGRLIQMYPNVNFFIENPSPTTFTDRKRNGYFLADVNHIIEVLNKKYPNKFAMTFDVCHMMMTEQQYLLDTIGNEKTQDSSYKHKTRYFEYDSIFDNYGDIIKNIHLNNIRLRGTTKDTHSQGFKPTERDKSILRDIFKHYNRTGCNAYITLEINEKDYILRENMRETLSVIREVLSELD